MKSLFYLVILSSLFGAACGGKASEQANTTSGPTTTQPVNSNVAVANIPPEFSAAANTAPGTNMPVNGSMKPPTKNEAAPKTYEFPEKDGPAPDDSDIKTVLGENLVQTRTFHSNAQIAKIEKTTAFVNGEPKTTVKVFLKNGQTKEINLKDALTAPAADLLKAIR